MPLMIDFACVIRSAMLSGTLLVCVAGCAQDTSSTPKSVAPANGAVHIEPVDDAVQALKLLGRRAWVFKHQGGELTADFSIFYRPEGKDSFEEVLYREVGSDTVLFLRSGESQESTGGYVIVEVPDRLSTKEMPDICFGFSLNGAHTRRTTGTGEIYPAAILSHSAGSVSERGTSSACDLAPGETVVLVDYVESRFTLPTDTPHEKRAAIRYLLTVTALKDGKLPEKVHDGQE